MNSLTRAWLTWWHGRKLAARGRHCNFPVPDLWVRGDVRLGDRCRFRNNVTLRAHPGGRIIFEMRSGCSWGCLLDAKAEIRIGRFSGIAEYSVLMDHLPLVGGNERGWQDVPEWIAPIHIGENCLVGSNCFVGPGVTMGDSSVLAPHSVLLESTGPLEVWAGIPARKVGHRTENVPEARLKEFQELVAAQGFRRVRYEEEQERRLEP